MNLALRYKNKKQPSNIQFWIQSLSKAKTNKPKPNSFVEHKTLLNSHQMKKHWQNEEYLTYRRWFFRYGKDGERKCLYHVTYLRHFLLGDVRFIWYSFKGTKRKIWNQVWEFQVEKLDLHLRKMLVIQHFLKWTCLACET